MSQHQNPQSTNYQGTLQHVSMTNCTPSYSVGGAAFHLTPAIAIDRAENGWIVTKAGYIKAVATTYEELLTILKAHFDKK